MNRSSPGKREEGVLGAGGKVSLTSLVQSPDI